MRRLLPLLAVVVLCVPAARAGVNPDSGALQVAVNNVENMSEPTWPKDCRGNWHALISWIRDHGTAPDLMLLQQIRDVDHLHAYIAELEAKTGAQYVGTLALDPPTHPQGTDCASAPTLKNLQTNAIIWRKGRLTPVAPASVPGFAHLCRADSKTVCFQSVYWKNKARACVEGTQDRTVNAALRLSDANGRSVAAVSIHWPSGRIGNQGKHPAGQDQCAKENAFRAAVVAGAIGGDLRLIGGDANIGDTASFDDAVRAAKYADVGYGLSGNWTGETSKKHKIRRDYLFAQTSAGAAPRVIRRHTVTWNEAGGRPHYSEHRAIVARIGY